MKKLYKIGAASLLALSLAACGADNDPEPGLDGDNAPTDVESPTSPEEIEMDDEEEVDEPAVDLDEEDNEDNDDLDEDEDEL